MLCINSIHEAAYTVFMGDYVVFSFTFLCGLILAVTLQAVQGSPRCCTSVGNTCNINTTNYCLCNSGSPPKRCSPAVGNGEICMECCYPYYLLCSSDSDGTKQRYCYYFRPDICRNKFFTFAQVALVCALATAFSALGAICWRICRGRTAASVTSLLRERESSLTSVQRFIIQRLQDRPPRYEDSNQIHLEKPPPYQEAIVDTIPRSLSVPFSLNDSPATPNEVPEETNSNLNCNESALHSNMTEAENFTNVLRSVMTNENTVQQLATQTEAVSVQNVQVNSEITSVRERTSSLEQRDNFPECFENAETKLTEEQTASLSENKHGVDNPAFSAETEVATETTASTEQHLN